MTWCRFIHTFRHHDGTLLAAEVSFCVECLQDIVRSGDLWGVGAAQRP
jgi:hypothetical protein